VKLLRVLQERTFEPVGSSKTQCVDVRVIAATNQDLERLIEERRFREDLFYRLHVLPIRVPPLRERTDDIPLLVHHFIDVANQDRGTSIDGITDAAMEQLVQYDWPGNVRQLENLMERMAILQNTGDIDVDQLPPEIACARKSVAIAPRVPPEGLSFNNVVDQVETDMILQALEQTHWNKNRAATLLGLNRTTLLEKIKKKGLRQREG
jgi:DNA-binding NtrC family response regulator